MQKETFTLQNIKEDFRKIVDFRLSVVIEWRMAYIVPITVMALLLGGVSWNVWVALATFTPAIYHIVCLILEYVKITKKRKAIKAAKGREDISISCEKLSHIATERIYEPYACGRHSRSYKNVKFYYFTAGRSWRLPESFTHYEWSKEFYLGSQGLQNISVGGNEFIYASLQGFPDVAYIYPCKYFEPDNALNE